MGFQLLSWLKKTGFKIGESFNPLMISICSIKFSCRSISSESSSDLPNAWVQKTSAILVLLQNQHLCSPSEDIRHCADPGSTYLYPTLRVMMNLLVFWRACSVIVPSRIGFLFSWRIYIDSFSCYSFATP